MKLLLLAILTAVLATAADRELSGKVVDADTGQPIVHAHVTVRFFQAAQPSPEVVLLTDTDGTFRMTNMPAGGYQVSCAKPGYLTANQGAPPPPAAMVIRMTAQAVIEGSVVDDREIPAGSTFIQLLRQQVLNGRKQMQFAQGGSTDETGNFRLYGLPAGRYYISIVPRLTGARRSKPVAYPQLYYPSALDIDTAQPVDLKAGDEMQIKVQLPAPIRAFTVSGVVATAAPNVSVMLSREASSQTFQQPVGEPNVDPQAKTFRIAHVPPGLYVLRATAQDGKNLLQASVPISVGGADVGGVRIVPADIALDGAVRIEGDTPPAGPSPRGGMGFVSLQSAEGGNGSPVDAEGKFHIPNLQPGTYRIAPQTYGQQCVRSILQGGRDVSEGVTIAPGVAPEPIEIVLSTHCGSVDVTLSASDSPPPNLTAYLLRKSGDEMVLERQGFQGPAGSDGARHFALQNVAPGDYTVYVWPQELPVEYTNAEYMRQFESYGQPVTVSDGGKATVTIDKVLALPKN
jgi:hypothetical protein